MENCANLNNLPTEIIERILSLFTHDMGDLKAAQIALPRHARIAFSIAQSTKSIIVRGPDAVRQCDELLAAIDQHAQANSTTGPILHSPIRFLNIKFYCQPDQSHALAASFSTLISRNKLPALQDVTLYVKEALDDGKSCQDNLMTDLGPHIRTDYDALMNAIDARGRSQNPAKPTNLRIKLEGCGRRNITTLLQSKPNINIKGVSVNLDGSRWSIETKDLLQQLSYAHNTLTDLTITNAPQGWHSKQEADFSKLTALLSLRVPAGVWFEHAALGRVGPRHGFVWMTPNSRPSIRAFLPPSLQELRVDFICFSRIFVTGPGYQDKLCSHVVHNTASLAKLQTVYEWMTELVDPDTGLKKLKRLQVMEGPMMEETRVLAWSPPADLLNAFQTAGVEFELRIRTWASSSGARGHLPAD